MAEAEIVQTTTEAAVEAAKAVIITKTKAIESEGKAEESAGYAMAVDSEKQNRGVNP